jgi:hypothetical protein
MTARNMILEDEDARLAAQAGTWDDGTLSPAIAAPCFKRPIHPAIKAICTANHVPHPWLKAPRTTWRFYHGRMFAVVQASCTVAGWSGLARIPHHNPATPTR